MRHVAGCGRRSPLNLCDVSPPVAVYSECTQHVHRRSLPPNFANGVSAGQSYNTPHRCRSGEWLNRTRRTDRLIPLWAPTCMFVHGGSCRSTAVLGEYAHRTAVSYTHLTLPTIYSV